MDLLLKKFLQYLRVERNYSNHTILSYENDLEQLQKFLKQLYNEDDFELKRVSKNDLKAFVADLYDRHYEPKSISRKIASIRSFFRFARRRGSILQNPSAQLIFPKIDKKLPEFLTEEETSNLMALPLQDTWSGRRDKAILELFYSSGIRLSELVNMKIGDFNYSDSTISVMGKGSKNRIVPIGRICKKAISDYLNDRKSLTSNTDSLFLTNRLKPITPSVVQNLVKKYVSKISEVKKQTPHILRHTFATHLMDNGADLRAVKDFLGHESLSTTQVYTHVSIDRLKTVYEQAHPKANKE